jgi:hypothetical protein
VNITLRAFYLSILAILVSVSAVTLIGIVELNQIIVNQLGGTRTVSIVIDVLLYGPQIPLYYVLFYFYHRNRDRLDVLKH